MESARSSDLSLNGDPYGGISTPVTVRRLVSPRRLALLNRWRRMSSRSRVRVFGFALLGVAFGGAIFALFHRALSYFLSVPDFGPVLTYKLLGMVFVTFFSILLFSNVVASLSSFYLSRDLDRLVAAPVPTRRLFHARFVETVLDSSWMMLVFALPAFLAYGVVHRTGPAFYLATALTLPFFLVIPAALAVVVVMRKCDSARRVVVPSSKTMPSSRSMRP